MIILGVVIITFIILLKCAVDEIQYEDELERIKYIEHKKALEEKELELIRSETHPCHIDNLTTPRACYVNSNYKCKWNEKTNRCDRI